MEEYRRWAKEHQTKKNEYIPQYQISNSLERNQSKKAILAEKLFFNSNPNNAPSRVLSTMRHNLNTFTTTPSNVLTKDISNNTDFAASYNRGLNSKIDEDQTNHYIRQINDELQKQTINNNILDSILNQQVERDVQSESQMGYNNLNNHPFLSSPIPPINPEVNSADNQSYSGQNRKITEESMPFNIPSKKDLGEFLMKQLEEEQRAIDIERDELEKLYRKSEAHARDRLSEQEREELEAFTKKLAALQEDLQEKIDETEKQLSEIAAEETSMTHASEQKTLSKEHAHSKSLLRLRDERHLEHKSQLEQRLRDQEQGAKANALQKLPLWRHRLYGMYNPPKEFVLRGKSLWRAIAWTVLYFYAVPQHIVLQKRLKTRDQEVSPCQHTAISFISTHACQC